MRLYDIDTWHPGMLDSLVRAHRERWSRTDERLAQIAELTHLVFRQLYAMAGNKDDLEPLRILRPGDEPPEKQWVKQMRELAM